MKMPHENYYETLELKSDAALEDISEAYRRLSLKYHPKNSAAETLTINSYKFHRLAEAYEVLSDPNKKGIYDIYGYEGLSNGILTQAGDLKGCYKYAGNAFEIFQKFMGTSNPFALIRDCQKNEEDWGSAFFSAYGGKNEIKKPKLPPIEVNLECSLEELYLGCVKEVKYLKETLNFDMRTTTKKEAKIDVEIFPGYNKNTIIPFKNIGDECPGEESSDLIIKIVEKTHKEYNRKGDDLIYYKKLTLAEALNSEPVKLVTLDNRNLSIGMDEIISPQSVKIIKGEGMPIYSAEKNVNDLKSKKGDLYIKFNIIFPEYISPEKKEEIVKLLEEEDN